MISQTRNFYIHIPFCRQKCPYCKFALTPIFDEIKKKRYLEYLKKEIRDYVSIRHTTQNSKLITPSTLYFGGGTPSILSLDELQSILDIFPKNSGVDTTNSVPEITLECNPEDITTEYIQGVLNLGVNRISLGVQSLNDTTLKAISRSDGESIYQALESIDGSIKYYGGEHKSRETEGSKVSENNERKNLVREVNEFFDPSGAFDTFQSGKVYDIKYQGVSVNIDLILGLPHSNPGETLENIQELHSRFPCITHTSVYLLEDGLYPKDWKKTSIKEELMQREYGLILEYFEKQGWNHYEISNWAKPGYECKHNSGYWNHTNTRGFGLSSASYEGGRRWENSHSFSGYYRSDRVQEETLTEEQIVLEKILFGVRTFSLDATSIKKEMYLPLIEKGLIKIVNEKIVLTSTGIFQENSIIAELISDL